MAVGPPPNAATGGVRRPQEAALSHWDAGGCWREAQPAEGLGAADEIAVCARRGGIGDPEVPTTRPCPGRLPPPILAPGFGQGPIAPPQSVHGEVRLETAASGLTSSP